MIKCIFVLLFLLSLPLMAKQVDNTLKIGFAQIPPYSYQTPEGIIKGLEVNIMRACFLGSEHKLEFSVFPYGRLPISLKNKEIDAQLTTLPTKATETLYFSDVVAPEYQVVAIHLTRNNLAIKSISDLRGKVIVAHQRAKYFYGNEYAEIANESGEKYSEYAAQMKQLKLLYNDLSDVIIIGINIFNHLKNQASFDKSAPITVSPIFGGKRGYKNAFHSEKTRDSFDKCLKKIKSNGVYQNIITKSLMYNKE
jgi:polar amino acid transport system substrate-binding protein